MADDLTSDSDLTVPQPGAPSEQAETLAFRSPLGTEGEEPPTCPAVIESPATDLPTVPGYTVTREIARGGMGVVYAARDPLFERDLAIKVMHAGQNADRFVVEAKVTAGLPHPGVPPVYALGALPDGRPFLAMKLVQGRTLAQELNGTGRADLPRLLDHIQRVCLTVGFAHARGIVHRDLKPSNVMIGAYGEVQVMDWGLAKLASEEFPTANGEPTEPATGPRRGRVDATSIGQVKGTPAYMPPEQARGEPVTDRSDVFALGGILAVVLTGAPPFAGDTVADTVGRAARADLTDCFARLETCGADAELVAVARKCLAPDPSDRYPSGEAVAAAVTRYRTGVDERYLRAERDRIAAEARAAEEANTRREAEARADAERASAAEQRKRRGAQFAAVVAVLVLVGAVGAFAWWRDKMTGERQLADERAEAERLRIEATAARLAGERDAEARHKADQARSGVRSGLALATDLRTQFKFKPAAAALAQAADLARSGAPELLPEAERAQTDLALVTRLDDIRFRKWIWAAQKGGRRSVNTKGAPPEYRRAFADHGLDLTTLAPPDAACRIAASAVKAELVTAIDDWALYEPDLALRNRLLEVARTAAPGPWSDRLRAPELWTDRKALAEFVADTNPVETAPAGLSVLAELMRRNKIDPAPLLTAARARHPSDFELAFALGQRYTLDRNGLQIGPYEAARALRPDNPIVCQNLSAAQGWRGDRDGEIAACHEFIRLMPKDAAAHSNLGVALREKGDLAGALAAGKRAVELDPEDAIAYDALGNTLARMDDLGGAIAAFRKAVEIDPTYARAHSNLGVALKSSQDRVGAIAAFRNAIDADPSYVMAHSNLGVTLHIQGDLEGAIASFRKAIQIDPRYALAHTTLGMALRDKHDMDGAIAEFQEAIRIDPRYVMAHNGLGELYLRQERYPEAINCARAALREASDYPEALVTLGLAHLKMGDVPSARAALTKAAKLDPQFRPLLARLPPTPVAPEPHEK